MDTVILQLDPGQADAALQRLSQAFAELAPGDALILETASHPRKLARRFCEEAWGQFDWAPLQAGDGAWRAVIRKRTEPGPQRLSAFLTEDHKRCDDLYAETENAARAGHAKRATGLFGMYELGMLRHLEMEEQVLFPELERRMGFFGQGPTAVMREEHAQIRAMIARMREALQAEDLEAFSDACETLLILMEQHNMKEEEMLYPMMDDALGGEEQDLLKQLITY